MVDSIVVIGVLTYALLYSLCDLKAAQMKVQHSLSQECMLYKCELGHIAMEVTKNICCVKGEGAVDHSTITKWLKNFTLVVRSSMIK